MERITPDELAGDWVLLLGDLSEPLSDKDRWRLLGGDVFHQSGEASVARYIFDGESIEIDGPGFPYITGTAIRDGDTVVQFSAVLHNEEHDDPVSLVRKSAITE